MGYEIPQKLQHKERIVFNLTFGQLGWCLLFGFIILIIFKSNLHLIAKFGIATIPSFIGVLFVFFDFHKLLKNMVGFFKFRFAVLGSELMSLFIGIKRIEDSVVFLFKGKVAILKVEPMNFSIKTSKEKESIIFGFQKFLNGLDFPVQFVVSSQNLNLDSYLDSLEKRANNKDLFDDFKCFINNLILVNNMHNRCFYLVIREVNDLSIQCSVCKERLESIGLFTERLNDKELLNCYKDFFNNNSIIENIPKKEKPKKEESKKKPKKKENKENKLKKLLEKIKAKRPAWLKKIIAKKKQRKSSNQLVKLISPKYIRDSVDCFRVNDSFCRLIVINGYPRTVESGFLDKIISSNDDFDISIHIEPFRIETTMVNLNKEIQKQRADLYAEKKKNSINPTLEIKLNDTLKVLDELQKGNQKLFNVSLYINCKAKSKEELNLLTKKVEAELNSLMIIPSIPSFTQVQGYQGMIPISKDKLKVQRNVTTGALSAFFPFTSPFLKVENQGVMLGLNKNGIPFIKDIFGLSNANGIVLATSGSGKSYFTKLLISRQLLNNTQVLIIDPQSEYIGLTNQVKGQLVTISRTSKTIINPLDLMGHDYIEKRLTLMDLFKVMFGDLSEIQRSILDKALHETYAKKGITGKDTDSKKKPPILGDLYKVLNTMSNKASRMELVTYRALLNRLYMYTEGVFSFLNKQTSINFNNDFVCFNIGNMPKQVKPAVMFLILDFIYMRMKQSKRKKLLIIDESWSLLGKAEEASYIFEIVKTCRKYNLGLLMITQDVADLLNSHAGHAVLANSSYSLLLRQKPSVIDQVVKTFNLSKMERNYLLTAVQGKGILIMDNDHQELSVVASPEEHKIITTNPNEKIAHKTKKQKIKQSQKQDINIEIDTEPEIIRSDTITDIDEKNYLINKKYIEQNFVPIGKTKQETFWIKTNKIESPEHIFLADQVKKQFQKINAKITMNKTKDADLIIKYKNLKPIAIEIETGTQWSKNHKNFKPKFKELKQKYGKNLIIVLSSTKFKKRYTNNLPNIKIILRQEVGALVNKVKKRCSQK
jgi:conjugal transfer ATP-binding protein TraC